MSCVTREQIDAICSALPGAQLALPPELVSWKVGGKMFACFGGEADMSGVSVKCPDVETAQMLIDANEAVRAPYFHKSWVRLPFDKTDPDYATLRIGISYDIIMKSLPKKLRAAFPAREEA